MKRFWHSWMAVAFSVAMISPAVAQNGGAEIGSYQSILSRAGYQSSDQSAQINAPAMPSQQGNGTQILPGNGNVVMGSVQQGTVVNGCGPGTSPVGQWSNNGCGPIAGGVGGCATGGSAAFGNGYAGGNAGFVSGDASCGGDPVYSPGRSFGSRIAGIGSGLTGGGNSNTVVSLFGLVFTRDYEDDRQLSDDGAGNYLFSTDADHNGIGGVGMDLVRRNCNGRGLGLRYWGLYSDTAQATLSPAPLYTNLTGLSDLTLGTYDVEQVYNYGALHTITRDTEIHNVEISILNNGGCYTTRRGRQANYELFGGFRWFEFDEDFRYTTNRDYGAGVPAAVPDEVYLNVATTNTLLGAQVGGRSEICLSNRLRFAGSTRVGLFNNHIESSQNIRELGGPFATVTTSGADYNFMSEKDDLSIIGEFDVSLIFQFSQKARFNIGYRAVGVSGIALAVDQIPYEFCNVCTINNIKSNGDLMLHGGYAGLEFSY